MRLEAIEIQVLRRDFWTREYASGLMSKREAPYENISFCVEAGLKTIFLNFKAVASSD
jgi:hypothetical protein